MDKGKRVSPQAKPKQKTLKGHEIPLPSRREIMEAFKKIARPKKG